MVVVGFQVIGSPHAPRMSPWFFFYPTYWWPTPLVDFMRSHNTKAYTNIATAAGESGFPDPQFPAIKVRKLSKIYGDSGTSKKALDDVDMDLFTGRVSAILGHNGAGNEDIE